MSALKVHGQCTAKGVGVGTGGVCKNARTRRVPVPLRLGVFPLKACLRFFAHGRVGYSQRLLARRGVG